MRQHLAILLTLMLVLTSLGFGSGKTDQLSPSGLTVQALRCEYLSSPLGIAELKPRLSWTVASTTRGQKQTAYHLLVASTREALDANTADMWDSGKVTGDQTVGIEYQGRPLQARARYFWKVRAYDKDGNAGPWSEPAAWEMALLSSRDWKADWISDGKPVPEKEEDFYKFDPAPLFRKSFSLRKTVRKARLYISGLGYYEAGLNAKKIGDSVLSPGWTNYRKRIYYNTYDVTGHLQNGENCLGVTLGSGWYNPAPLKMWGHLNLREHLPTGRPRFIAQLHIDYADGSTDTVTSDESWKVTDGPLLRNSIYLGEVYDARLEVPGWDRPGFDDTAWRHAANAEGNTDTLVPQSVPPIKITAALAPVSISEPQPGVYVVDMGQNFAGWARFAFDAPKGTRIRMRYGELLHPDGTLNPMTGVCGQIKGPAGIEPAGSLEGAPPLAWQQDVYISKGSGQETYCPRFTWHGFRFVEITGLPKRPALDSITGLRLNSAVAQTGQFSCSGERLNAIQKMCQWTFLSNIFSVQSDCPHRERFAYGGDLVTTSEAFIFNYDMAAFYAKAVQDWHDAALQDGMLTDTAPFVGIQYCGVAWAMAHPHTQLQLYRYYGDKRIVENQYDTAKRWLERVMADHPNGIIREGLSDHEGLEANPPESMVTPLYCQSAEILSELATLAGRSQDAKRYRQLAEHIRSAYRKNCVDSASGKCGPGSQAAQTLALSLQMLPESLQGRAFDCLLREIESRNTHLSTGIFGTRRLPDLLCRNGRSQTAYELVNQNTFPGWGHMLENGATTLWEHWEFSDNTYSHNHPMFGSVSQWFYNWLGGIQPCPTANGFDRIIIRPQIVGDLEWVKCSYDSVRGLIRSDWQRSGNTVTLSIEIPANTTAVLHLPTSRPETVTESGLPADQSTGLRYVGVQDGAVVYHAVSGRYQFTVTR